MHAAVSIYVAFLALFVSGAALVIAVTARTRARETRARFQTVASNVALVSSVAAIVALTLTPIRHRITGGAHEVQLLPLGDIVESIRAPDTGLLLEEASNMLLFVPLGAALKLRGFGIVMTALTAMTLSGSVEIVQLLLVSGRTTSVDDVLLNTLGAVLGCALVSLLLPPRGVLQ
jgi:glycopeptide antibiotics resistance protein